MADITLAEFQGAVWLVGGEPYIDDLLAGTLADDVSIELVPCENKSEVVELWERLCGPSGDAMDPWIIHPAIVARIRRSLSQDTSVFFAEWSALLDREAKATIASIAAWVLDNPGANVDLIEFLDPRGPKAIEGLSQLRAQLIEDELVEAGVAREVIGRARRDLENVVGATGESQRIDIAVKIPEAKQL